MARDALDRQNPLGGRSAAVAASALMIWVGQAASNNYRVGLETGTWGFKSNADAYQSIAVGDYVIFGRGHSGRGPRVSNETWAQGTISEINVCRVTKPFWEGNSPHWPDESQGNVIYPHRVGIEPVWKYTSVSLKSNILTAKAFEALQWSANNQGKGKYVEEALIVGPDVMPTKRTDSLIDSAAPVDERPEEAEPQTESVQLRNLSDLVAALKEDLSAAQLKVTDDQLLRFVSSLLAKRFLLLTGLAGSGKTKIAEAFARWITPTKLESDVFYPGARIASDRTTYHVGRSDEQSVEFWNSEEEDQATKVTLPREMIAEWADYIRRNAIAEDTPVRTIREGVKKTSKFSDQLHSFETHLKASAFALLRHQKSAARAACYELVPVGADWTGNENILGYPNGLDANGYVSKPAVQLILRAARHPNTPHFLILDEMNLSHVERYFADILSTIESDGGIELYPGDMTRQDSWRKSTSSTSIPPRISGLPANLFIIGTVNVDETTYMFSPKVLDRANVIEFRMTEGEISSFLANPEKPSLSKLDGAGAAFGAAFAHAARDVANLPGEAKSFYESEMLLFFKALQSHGAEFGFRTAHEAARFVHFYDRLSIQRNPDALWFTKAFDSVIVQKVLPKLHGSRAKLAPLLKKLWFLCIADDATRTPEPLVAAEAAARSNEKKAEPASAVPAGARYPLSGEKIGRMWRLLTENGFTSFAEA